MTKLNETVLEELSVKELKDLIKENSESTDTKLPAGMWKMKKEELIEIIEDIFGDLIEEEETEAVETETVEVEEVKPEEVKPKEKVENETEKTEEKKPNRRGKIVLLTLENGEEIQINGTVKFHQYMKDNFPEYKSWSMLSSVLKGEENEKTEKFEASGMKLKYAEGFEYGHKNQYTK